MSIEYTSSEIISSSLFSREGRAWCCNEQYTLTKNRIIARLLSTQIDTSVVATTRNGPVWTDEQIQKLVFRNMAG